MRKRITVGGTVHVMGGRAAGWAKRIQTWNALDPERAREEVTGGHQNGLTVLPPRTRHELLPHMIEGSGVGGHLSNLLLVIHTALCDFFIRRISAVVLRQDGDVTSGDVNYTGGAHNLLTPETDIAKPGIVSLRDWVQKRYNKQAHDLRFWITSDALIGKHYSNSAWLLKNMRFTGWQPLREAEEGDPAARSKPGAVVFRGFCRQEPVSRIRQLLQFPIETFGVDLNSLPLTDWPEPPTLDDDAPVGDVLEAARDMQPVLEQWERYYETLTEKISELERVLIEE
jgi:hypothetical protein